MGTWMFENTHLGSDHAYSTATDTAVPVVVVVVVTAVVVAETTVAVVAAG